MKKILLHPRFIAVLAILALYSCVQETHDKKITFALDMSGIKEFNTVGIRGDIAPLSWQETVLLEDNDKDSIYSASVLVNTASNQLNFKFVINDMEFELEGQDNRSLPFYYKQEEIEYTTSFDSDKFNIVKKQ